MNEDKAFDLTKPVNHIKIVSNGTLNGTLITGKDGQPIGFVSRMQITIDEDKAINEVTITIKDPIIDIEGDFLLDITKEKLDLKKSPTP